MLATFGQIPKTVQSWLCLATPVFRLVLTMGLFHLCELKYKEKSNGTVPDLTVTDLSPY